MKTFTKKNVNSIGGTFVCERLHNRVVCPHNIDHVINDEHNRIIIVVLARHEIAP